MSLLRDEQLRDLRERLARGEVDPYGASGVLLDHIDALSAENASLRARGEAAESVVGAARYVISDAVTTGDISQFAIGRVMKNVAAYDEAMKEQP